ncbi:hypothetical protein [Gilliamella apicola]|uniref:hypothetical protein n=1 Tax=Gilliamella apicola TaxID=1196095 RepID=UPI001179AF53|nr:hypothetical protein [Gilliamella apicola]
MIINYFVGVIIRQEKPNILLQLILKKMHQVATESCSENDTMKNMLGNVQPQDVYAALIAINQYGENYLSRKNK